MLTEKDRSAMKKTFTFRCTKTMENSMNELMLNWELDRTSIIKLSLYLFSIHMKQSKLDHHDLHGLIREIENLAPQDFPDYATFAD
jgi:hypothetical protein